MEYKKFKLYSGCSRFLFIFFISISCIYASCSNLHIVDDWEWLDKPEFAHAKKAVFKHYREMAGDYLRWRESTNFEEPDTFNTVAAKARILLIDESGDVEDVIEANHGREILHASDKFDCSSPNYFHQTMFLPQEEQKYLEVLKAEQVNLKQFGAFCSWHTMTLFIDKHPIIKDAINTYRVITDESAFYTNQSEQRKKNITQSLRDISHDLRDGIYETEAEGGITEIVSEKKNDGNKTKESEKGKGGTKGVKKKSIEDEDSTIDIVSEKNDGNKAKESEKGKGGTKKVKHLFSYRDMHQYDAEAFACDNLFKHLECYQKQYNKQKIKAFVLFLTERDPCLCCSVTIKDHLSRKIFDKKLCSEVVPIVVSLANYKERKWNEEPTSIIIRDKIKTMVNILKTNQTETQNLLEEEEEETEDPLPPCTLHLYRNESLTEEPIHVAKDTYEMFRRKVNENMCCLQ